MINLNPEIWGPHAWFFIESIVIALPENISIELQNELKHFFISISLLLPCEACRFHFSESIKKTDIMNINFSTKTKVLEWLNKIHNNVRKRTKNASISTQDTIKYYNSKYNIETKTSYLDIFLLIIFIGIILFILKYFYFPINIIPTTPSLVQLPVQVPVQASLVSFTN